MKQWINNLIDKIGEKWACVLLWVLIIVGLFIVSTIHYFLFTKPVEDRVNAEWQEKYDEMVGSYEYQTDSLKEDYEEQIWKLENEIEELNEEKENKYDEGYYDGYSKGYNDGLNDK